jgi:tetratricopeptide (TPR) repeat protein
MELAQCHMEAGDWRPAAEELDLARDIDPWIPEGHSLRGQVAAAEGQPELALDCHRRAWRLAPQRADLAYAYAYAQAEREDWQGVLDTLADFTPAAVRGDLRADISACTAEALLYLGRAHDAMQVLQEAADLDEDDESIQDNLAAVTFLVMADA